MSHLLVKAVGALFIASSTVAVVGTANAQSLRNFTPGTTLIMSPKGKNPVPGTAMISYGPVTDLSQIVAIERVYLPGWPLVGPSGDYPVRLRFPNDGNQCASTAGGVAGGGFKDGTAVILWPCYNTDDQLWDMNPAGQTDSEGHSCYYFTNRAALLWGDSTHKNEALGIAGGSKNPGASLILWLNFGNPVLHPDQLWCF